MNFFPVYIQMYSHNHFITSTVHVHSTTAPRRIPWHRWRMTIFWDLTRKRNCASWITRSRVFGSRSGHLAQYAHTNKTLPDCWTWAACPKDTWPTGAYSVPYRSHTPRPVSRKLAQGRQRSFWLSPCAPLVLFSVAVDGIGGRF